MLKIKKAGMHPKKDMATKERKEGKKNLLSLCSFAAKKMSVHLTRALCKILPPIM